MFEDKRERDYAPMALTLWALLVIIAGVGGWLLMNNLKKSQMELVQANQALQVERTKAAVDRQASERCAKEMTTAKTDLGTCNTALETERAHVKQLESVRAAAPAAARPRR